MSKVLEASVRLFDNTSEAEWDWTYVECQGDPGEPSLRTDVQVLVPTLDMLVKIGNEMLHILGTRVPHDGPDRATVLELGRQWDAALDRS